MTEDKIDFDKKQDIFFEKVKEIKKNIEKMKNLDFTENEDKNEKKLKDIDEENGDESSSEKTSTQKLYEIQKIKLNIPISDTNKDNILTKMDELIAEIDSISDSILSQKEINDLINNDDIILTSNYSQQVAEILIENAKTKKFKVLVAESAPLFNNKSQAEILIKNGIDTTIVDDDDIYDIMNKLTKIKVFIGARAFLVNGGLITYGGAYNICLAANMFSIPVIIVGGTTKLTPMHAFKHDLYNEFLSPSLIYGKDVKYEGDISSIQFNNPSFDYVPPNLMIEAWSKLADAVPGTNLKAALTSSVPHFDPDKMEIHFEVKNAAQKEWIDKNRRIKMEETLRHELGRDNIRLFIDVAEIKENNSAARLYMPSDRADYLTKNSEEFRNLKIDFGLEVN